MTFDKSTLLAELHNAGLSVTSIWDMVNSNDQYPQALPVLQRWIRQLSSRPEGKEYDALAEGVVRAASVPAARPWLAPDLIDQFKLIGGDTNLAWVIGNAILVTADDSSFDEIVALSQDTRYGIARQNLVLWLGRSKRSESARVLEQLLSDDDVVLQALDSLLKLRVKAAVASIERLLLHSNPFVRKQAKKALVKLAS